MRHVTEEESNVAYLQPVVCTGRFNEHALLMEGFILSSVFTLNLSASVFVGPV